MKSIVATDAFFGIGKAGDLLIKIPDDMHRFRELTLGSDIIMGRCTFESISGPLPGRRNIVLSGTMEPFEGVEVARSVDEALEMADPDAWVIGGQMVYESMLPHCERVFLTKMDFDGHADRFFPNLDSMPGWVLDSESETMIHEGIGYRYLVYHRV